MNEFVWGMVCGGVASPFVWEGLKWCYGKFTGLLDRTSDAGAAGDE